MLYVVTVLLHNCMIDVARNSWWPKLIHRRPTTFATFTVFARHSIKNIKVISLCRHKKKKNYSPKRNETVPASRGLPNDSYIIVLQ